MKLQLSYLLALVLLAGAVSSCKQDVEEPSAETSIPSVVISEPEVIELQGHQVLKFADEGSIYRYAQTLMLGKKARYVVSMTAIRHMHSRSMRESLPVELPSSRRAI